MSGKMPLQSKSIRQILCLWGVMLLLTGCTGTGSMPDVSDMLVNLAKSYPSMWRLVTATAYVIGFVFIAKGVIALKAFGESRTMMSQQSNTKAPFVYFIVGSVLIYSPTAFNVLMQTVFGTTTIMQYGSGTSMGLTYAGTQALIGLVQFIGLCAFIRGWFYIARMAEANAQPGAMGKAITHIAGGILAINIVATQEIIFNTFGFSSS